MRLVWRGMGRGAMAGAGLAAGYIALVIPLFGLLLVATNAPQGKTGDALIGAGMFAICAWPVGILLGVLPGALVGAVGGAVTGAIAAFLRRMFWAGEHSGRPYKAGIGAMVGLGVGLSMAILANVLLAPGMMQENMSGIWRVLPYLFWVLGPSVAMIGGLTWVGWSIMDM